MPAPTILKRNLTFHFPRAVSVTNQTPQTLEVVVVPLSDPSAPDQGTYVGGLQRQTVLLDDDDNVLTFSLVPSNSPDLLAPVNYRVAWREGGVLGRTFTYDFAMPDSDIRFDELADLGQIIGGESYLHQEDLGVPGRVAKLNSDGIPVDANNHPMVSAAVVTALSSRVDSEVTDRTAADEATLFAANQYTIQEVSAFSDSLHTTIDSAVSDLGDLIATEASARTSADTTERNARIAADDALGTRIDSLATTLGVSTETLGVKADLDSSGHIPVGQIPNEAITNAVSVSTQSAMLALTIDQVQPGDLAVRPDGVFGLFGTDPAVLSNWIPLTKVSSVNGQQGTIVLGAADVGALPVGGSISISQVTGLATSLSAKADATALSDLTSTVNTIRNDATLVRTSGGVISSSLLDSRVAYVNSSNQVTLKDGTVIASGTGDVFSINGMSGDVTLTATDVGAIATGTTFSIASITGLQTALNNKVAADDSRLSDARTPTSHASSHAADGTDAISISVSQVTGLSTTLSGLATTSTATSLSGRVSYLETQITDIVGGGGGSPVSKDVWWDTSSSLSGQAVPASFKTADAVRLKSPFGKASNGTYYIDPAGATDSEVLWPYISPNGHLELRRWDESGAADIVYATQSDLDSLTAQVALKATQVDLTALRTAVSAKAEQIDLNALQAVLADKATVSSVNALNTAIVGFATQNSVDALGTLISNKANQADMTNLTITVGGKASQADLTTLTSTVSGITTTLTSKADLVTVGTDKKVPLSQIPVGIPQSSVASLTETLATKADLVSGKLNVNQLPAVPIAGVTGLNDTLATKADLVAGKLATSQLPAIAMHSTWTATTRAGMLALSGAQIGDICILADTSNPTDPDRGTYTLIKIPSNDINNWILNVSTSAVLSVNGQKGIVNLSATDVRAYSSDSLIPQDRVANLTTQLGTYATTSALASAVADKQNADGVRSLIGSSPQIKQKADYVSTTPIDIYSGLTTIIDGVNLTAGKVVLLTAQRPVDNGLYVVNSGDWTRVGDMQSGSYFVRGSLVVVTGGQTKASTVWQLTSSSGVVGTNGNEWTQVLQATPPTYYNAGNGLSLTGNSFTVQSARGIAVSTSGVATDPSVVAHKFVGDVPAGTTTCSIAHKLGSSYPIVQVFDSVTKAAVLVGWTATGPDTVALEFASAPIAGQWKVVVIG